MRFSRIVLENWRNFGSVDVTLQNRAFLVGPNASGKSNFLDAFRFLRDLVVPGGGFEQAVISRGFYHIRHMLAVLSPVPNVVIQIELQNEENVAWRYRIAFTDDNQRRPILIEEKIWKANELVLDRPNENDKNDPEQLRQTYLEQAIANREFRELTDFFESIHYFHLVPHLVRDPDRVVGQENDPFGSDFLQQIADLNPTEQQTRLGLISNVLELAVSQLHDLELQKDKRGIAHLLGFYQHLLDTSKGSYKSAQNESDFSDGTLRLIGLLWSLLEGTGPLLLEEPELSLHPSVVRHIPQMMLSIQRERPYRQTLLSTHSSDLLSDEGIAADEILLFIPAEGGTEVKVGADIEQVKHLLDAGLPPGEVVIPYTEPPNVNRLSLFGD